MDAALGDWHHDEQMTRRHWWIAAAGSALLAVVLATVAAFWGPAAWEVVSWIAGAASLLVSIFAVYHSVSAPSAPSQAVPPMTMTQTAHASGHSRVYQAGHDMGDVRE
nr:hypothetical protein OHB51_23460 [Micromonospora sp. NBC_00855]